MTAPGRPEGEDRSAPLYRTILVPIDDSATARRGLAQAVALAAAIGAELHVLHVVDARLLVGRVTTHASPEQLLAAWRDEGWRHVRAAVADAQARGVRADGAVRCDPGLRVCEHILAESERTGAGLIVMGTRGRSGLRRAALGSDAELVLRGSMVPVLLVRGGDDADTAAPGRTPAPAAR